MTTLPEPPASVPLDARCVVHAACLGDQAGAQDALDGRAQRLATLGHALGQAVQPATEMPPGRCRVSLRPLPDGRLGQALPRTHDLHPVAWCGLAHPAIQAVLPTLPPMPRGLGDAELRTDGDRVVLAAHSRGPRFRKTLAADLRKLALPVHGVASDGQTVQGDPTLSLRVGGITHQVGPDSFTQVHLDTNAALVAAVMEEAAGATAVLDLYAGCGNLSLPLALAGAQLTMIEASAPSCSDARRTAKAHGLTVDVRQGDAGRFQAGDAFFDLAVLDPPRAGAPGVLAQVVTTRPSTIIFVCCNPGHLARDLRPALESGYAITRLQAFDMFPLTRHVEVLAVLRRT